jgi:hypothetical protein
MSTASIHTFTSNHTDDWPISKETLTRKHFKIFVKFTNEISFGNLNELSNPLRQAS